jgi:hypothetical protein
MSSSIAEYFLKLDADKFKIPELTDFGARVTD